MVVVRVDRDQLVWASEIAERLGRSRQSIDLLYRAQRGPGDFPKPVAGNIRNPLWRWSEVETWFARYEAREPDTERETIVGAFNAALDARRYLRAGQDGELADRVKALIAS